MNVAILKGPEQMTKRIMRSLQTHQINGDLTDKINNKILMTYDFLIVTSDQKPKIPYRVIEQVVLQKQIVLVYIHQQSSLTDFYNLIDDPYFLPISSINVVETLPGVLTTIHKWEREVKILKRQLDNTNKVLKDTKTTMKAKRLLMNTGMTEEEAHNWIQKVAMDKRLRKSDVVNLIIEEKIDIG